MNTKSIFQLSFSLLLGIAIGWYVGYTRPEAKRHREILRGYRDMKENVLKGMSDKEIVEMGSKVPEAFADLKRQDEMAAVIALSAFRSLEQGDMEAARKMLLKPIGSYYRLHNKRGNKILVAEIEKAGRQYPAIAAEISPEMRVIRN